MFSSGESESENVLEENYIDFGVKDISNLHLKSNISTLNLHYNSITVIKGLDLLVNLRHLDLSSNLIAKISGLDSLIFLRTLNLSANRIKKLDGISKLQQLVKLNISYNEICDISGLSEFINISEHPITSIEMQGNKIKLITHVIKHCQRLINLRQLTLLDNNSTNPVCNIPDYRKKILASLMQIRILDGKDRDGNPIEINILSDIPGLEQFLEYLSSSTDHYSEITQHEPVNIKSQSKQACLKQSNNACCFEEESSKDEQQSKSEMKLRLKDLEEKLESFVAENQEQKVNNSKSNKVENENQEKNKENKFKETKKPLNKEKKDSSDYKIANLLKELDQERYKRVDLENKLQLVINKYKDTQLILINDKKSKEDALKSTERLTHAFSQEKSLRQELENKVRELQTILNGKENEILDLRKKMESSNVDIVLKLELKEKQLVSKSEEVLQITKELDECKLAKKMAESNAVSIKKHCSNLEDQVDNLQSTLSRREKEYQMSLANRYSLDSNELKDYVEKQVNAAKSESMHEINAWKSKLADSNNQYKDLENEFRLALHMEAERYKKIEQSYLQLLSETNSNKSKIDSLTRKDDESKSLISELTTVVKDQKSKLIEISKSKQESNRNNKERIMTLEAHLEEARRQMIQFELTKQENKKIQAKLSAQESVLEGLRAERKLWSEELAQQGYLLTQDRAKLECKIEAQSSEINCLKMELEKESETLKIKSKIIEDQTATILKIKQGLAEKDIESKAFTEKLLLDQKEMENQVDLLTNDISNHKDTISKLTKRKEELKDLIVELQEKLDESEASRDMINQKWKDKSELIAKLENQVLQMKNYWEKKTACLIDERNEAREKSDELQLKLESIDQNYKSQIEMAYKNRDFIRQEADERVAAIEDEMRRLLLETDEEKKKLNSRLRILNKAIQELEVDQRN